MKTKLLIAALLASAALIGPVQAGGHYGGGGGGFAGGGRGFAGGGGRPSFGGMPAGRFGGGPGFHSMPARSFGGNRMIYSGQRFSSVGPRQPGSMEFRPRIANSNAGSVRAHQFAQGNNNRINRVPRLANGGIQSAARQGRNGQFRNGNGTLRSNWRNHAFAQHSANWHRDWDRHHDHFFHGHRFVFIDGFWWGFDAGFDPWWPWWYYPYDYYGYGNPYPSSYGYDYYPGY